MSKPAPQAVTRRSFYEVCIHGLSVLMGAALAIPGVVYLFAKPRTKQTGDWVEAADLNQLQPGKPEEVLFNRSRVDGWRVVNEKTSAWVVKMDDQTAIAYSPACTHLGCAYHWDEQQSEFVCPCHNSMFSVDGKVLSGPAPRPLDRLEIRVENRKLFIGTRIQRS